MTHKLHIEALVTRADGREFYWEGHRWNDVGNNMLAWFQAKLEYMGKFAKDNHGKKEDDDEYSVKLTAILDDNLTTIPVLTFTGVSYNEVMKFEREFEKVGNELMKIGEGKAAKKKADKAAKQPKQK